jgi:hypothetical protein
MAQTSPNKESRIAIIKDGVELYISKSDDAKRLLKTKTLRCLKTILPYKSTPNSSNTIAGK